MLSKNHSYFFVPFRVRDIDRWKDRIESKVYYNKKQEKCTMAWKRIENNVPIFLMKFVNDGIGYCSGHQYAYQLVEKREYGLPYTDGKRKLLTCTVHHKNVTKEYTVDIRNIKIHCFGTNVGFLVYDVWYSAEMEYDDILEFNYLFKKVGISSVEVPKVAASGEMDGKIGLNELSKSLITNGLDDSEVEMFFHVNNVVRMKSNIFTVFCDASMGEIKDKLFHFCYAYNRDYAYNSSYCDDAFCCYHPYPYINWGYCQDGIACVYYDINNFTSYDLNGKIQNEYYFMYLVLLNQRYTMLALINEMMNCKREIPEEWKRIQEKLIEYQIEYSFHIISDEMVYHRIYRDLRGVLSIDELEKELKDVSDRMYMLKNAELREREEASANYRSWRTDIVLGLLSLMAVFSAFVDSTDILNRWYSVNGEEFHLLVPHLMAYGIIVLVAGMALNTLWDSYKQYRKAKEKDEPKEQKDDI